MPGKVTMKISYVAFALITLLAGLIFVTQEVSATSTCTISATVCKGQSYVDTTTGGVSSSRCFFLDTDSTLGNHVCSSTQDRATWEMNQGACVTLYYFDVTTGAVPPAVPNKVTLSVKIDNGATVVITFLTAGTEPANGASYSFCATSTGITGAAVRTGTYRIYLNPVKDNGAGGIGNYNIDSDGVATVGAIIQMAKGALRANMLVSGLSASSPPSGSQFAYGVAADELVTVTATRGQQSNTGTINFDTRHASAGSIIETSSTVTSAAAATDTATFVIDNTYDAASTAYDIEYNIISNAALTSLPWTTFPSSGHGSGISQITTTKVRNTAQFTADPRIKIDSDGAGTFATADEVDVSKLTNSGGAITDLFNKGEIVYHEWFIFNARSELLSRSMTFVRQDVTPTQCQSYGSMSPTSSKYSVTFTLGTGSTCLAAADTTGSARYIKVTNTDQSYVSLPVFYVSSLLFIDAHIQLSATLVHDDYPTENSAEDIAYIISTAQTDTIHGWCHVKNVRKDINIDTSGSQITWSYIDSTPTNRLTGTTDTGADGWTATHLDLLASTPLGNWNFECVVSFNGNSATNDQLFTVSVPAGTGGGFPGDPIRVFTSPMIANPSETIIIAISESLLDGTARTGNAAGTLIYLYDSTNTLILNGVTPTEIQYGAYRYSYALGSSPTLGSWIVLIRTTDVATGNPIGSSNTFMVETDTAATLLTNQASQTTTINGINTNVNTIGTNVGTINTNVNTIGTNVGTINTNVNTIGTNVNTIGTNVGTINTNVNTANTNINEVAVDTDTLLTNQASQTTTINGINTNVNTINTNVNTINTNVNSVLSNQAIHLIILNEIEDHTDTIGNNQTAILNAVNNIQANLTFVFGNQTLSDLMNITLYVPPYTLIIAAIVFFAVIAEWKKDVLYWFFSFLMSLYLLINRPEASIVPVPIFVGWIFVTLYQMISLLSNGRAKNLGGDNDE